MSLALAGRVIVVTRPSAQAGPLCQALAAQGAQAVLFPVIDIAPLDDLTELRQLHSRLADYHLVFFVSANAVDHAFSILADAPWPAHVALAAVGPSTAAALHARGFASVIVPRKRFDSESVLDLSAFQADAVRGKRILILRGDGGRELLADTLRERGATVDLQRCYQRRRAPTDPAPLLAQYAQGKLDALIFTSSEGARYFAQIVGAVVADKAVPMLAELPSFVPHIRIAEQLGVLGAQQVIVTAPGDEGIIAALVRHFG